MRKFLIVCLVLGLGVPAMAVDPIEDPESLSEMPAPDSAYYRYLKSRLLKCTGDGAKLDKPMQMTIAERKYTYDGDSLVLEGADPDGTVTIGVLGAVKDFSRETRAALDFYLARFEKEKVDVLVLNGDIAATEFEITQVVLYCAKRGWPVLALIGNTEGRTAFNRALLASLKVAPNVINFDFVRRIELGGATLVSLPGYLDRKFVHQSGGCTYKPREVDLLTKFTKDPKGVLVMVSHGPPAGEDKNALDTAVEAGNVGDARLAGFLREQKVPFGIFSHILEAGGRAVNTDGKVVKPKAFIENFHLNVGSANPLPWQLNSGKLSCGMGALVKFKDGKGSFEFIDKACK
jgi:Icc-related predicted phosphoesterase